MHALKNYNFKTLVPVIVIHFSKCDISEILWQFLSLLLSFLPLLCILEYEAMATVLVSWDCK